MNNGFEKLTGYTRQDAIGRNCHFLQGPEASEQAVVKMRDAIAQGKSLILDVLNYRKDGTPFWNRISRTPVEYLEGEITHYIGIQSDISRMILLQNRLKDIALELAATKTIALD